MKPASHPAHAYPTKKRRANNDAPPNFASRLPLPGHAWPSCFYRSFAPSSELASPQTGLVQNHEIPARRRLDSGGESAYLSKSCAPVAQLDRALASGAKGREFESRRAHHNKSKDLDVKNPSPFFVGKIVSNPISNPEPQSTTHLNV